MTGKTAIRSGDVLRVTDLTVDFPIQKGTLRAVDQASFRIRQGKTTALVGESGSGKSVCSQAIMAILPNIAHVAGGQIVFNDPANDAPPVDLLQFAPDGPGPAPWVPCSFSGPPRPPSEARWTSMVLYLSLLPTWSSYRVSNRYTTQSRDIQSWASPYTLGLTRGSKLLI